MESVMVLKKGLRFKLMVSEKGLNITRGNLKQKMWHFGYMM